MPFDLTKLIRPDIAAMEPYNPILPFDVLSTRLGRPPEEIVKLDANENPYGPSPRIYEALASEVHYHIYPDPDNNILRDAISRYLGMDKSYIVAGHGADELIDLSMRLLIQPGDVVINCPPTFGMYSFDTNLNNGKLVSIARHPDFSVDFEAIQTAISNAARPKLLFVTSPNNPDGGVLSDGELRRLLTLPVVVILDEAYVEFFGPSRAKWVTEFENLVVLRTFSKWAGLAGLRVGYGVFPKSIVSHLRKIKQPYNVNLAATVAASTSLNDVAYLMGNVAKILREREQLYQQLTRFDFLRPHPSQANFILCHVLARDARQLKLELEEKGVLVRHFSTPRLNNYIRISVGKPNHTAKLLSALRELA